MGKQVELLGMPMKHQHFKVEICSSGVIERVLYAFTYNRFFSLIPTFIQQIFLKWR